jgi:uncharacterized Zn-finger protein
VKPEAWPQCVAAGCGKLFSRRDNWRQHLKLHAEKNHPRTKHDPLAVEALELENARMKKRHVKSGKSNKRH